MTEATEQVDGDDAPDYAWLLSKDEHLRAFILKHYGSGAHEIDGRILVSNMDSVFHWIKDGTVPVPAATRSRTLKAVGEK